MREENIYNYLMAETEFSALLDSDSIGWVSTDKNSSYPRVTYNIISRPKIVDASDEWQRWRFYLTNTIIDSTGKDGKFVIREIADVLTDLLNGVHGTIDGVHFDFIQKIDESEINLRDDEVYEMYIDFRILYH